MPLPVLPACLPTRRRVSARAWVASGRPRPRAHRAGGRAAGLGFTLGGGNQSASLGSTSLTGWIKYRVLDEGGTEQASGRDYLLGTGKWEYLQTGVRIAQAGTIEVMAGTSGSGEAVYFDNLRVEQSGGLIVQEQHQYAYGAPLPGLSYVVGSKRYRYGYQGQYAERDSVTGFESFELRLYNSRVGRWMSYDPEGQFNSPYIGMGNNPVSGIDPDGGWNWGGGLAKGLSRLKTGEIVGKAARTGLSTGARIGLQAASSGARVMKPASSYDYSKSYIPGKPSEDISYILQNNTLGNGSPVSRAIDIVKRDWNASGNASTIGPLRDVGELAMNLAPYLKLGGIPLLTLGTKATGLRRVGEHLESVQDVLANPSLLSGKTPQQVEAMIGRTPGWQIEQLGKGSRRGQGWVLREYGPRGSTGRLIRWHPGGGHHGSQPYWRVGSENGNVGPIF